MNSKKRRNGGGKALTISLTLAVVAVIAPTGSQAATPKLMATVGPGFAISLKTPAGKKVTALKPGAYAIIVNDRSPRHDFRLNGPGVNKVLSNVSAVGKKTVTVQLRAGRYRFSCQPHAAAMHGAFTVK